ncbi:MAG: carboxymuconolactone decarboxylase [Pseudonocardiales bacterium]|nr:MAG: carboxymuconolactone decarboxylase [Pseudonocardiales bacterium]
MTPPSRLASVAPAALDADQLRLYRELVDGPRGRAGDIPLVDNNGALVGPFAVMAVSPAVGDAVQRVGASLRYASVLNPLVREAAVLLVAAHHGSAFEWRAHEGAARRLGLDDDQLGQLRQGRPPAGLAPPAHQALIAVAALLRTRSLDEETYAATRAGLGERALSELVWLVGYYAMLALALRVFDPTVTTDRA